MNDQQERRFTIDPDTLRRLQNRRDFDHYDLQQALRVTNLRASLEVAGVVSEQPVLLTYKGRKSGHIERFPAKLG